MSDDARDDKDWTEVREYKYNTVQYSARLSLCPTYDALIRSSLLVDSSFMMFSFSTFS